MQRKEFQLPSEGCHACVFRRSAPVHAGLSASTPKRKRPDCGAEVDRAGHSPLAARLARRLSFNVASASKDKIPKSRRGASNTLLHIHKNASASPFITKIQALRYSLPKPAGDPQTPPIGKETWVPAGVRIFFHRSS